MEKVDVFRALEVHIDAVISELGYPVHPSSEKVGLNSVELTVGETIGDETVIHFEVDGDKQTLPSSWRRAVSDKLGDNLAAATSQGKDVETILCIAMGRLVTQQLQWVVANKDKLKELQ